MIHHLRRHTWRAYRRLSRTGRRTDLPRLAFVHLPKCGGTSLKTALQDVYARAGRPTVWLDARASKRAADAAGEDLLDARARLLLYHLAQPQPGYLAGHYVFTEAAWDVAPEACSFLTVLRDPVDRWYSAYFYNRYKTHSDHFRIREPLDAFVASEEAREMGRMYTRRLTADRDAPDAADAVVATLRRFDVVGVLEEMGTLVRDCERLIGERLAVPQLNTSPRGADERADEITPAVDAAVRRLCEPDLRVYEAVREQIARDGRWRPA